MTRLNFFPLQDRTRKSTMKPPRKIALGVMMDNTPKGSSVCGAKLNDLARDCVMSRPAFIAAFDWLAEHGLVSKVTADGNRSMRIVNEELVMRLGRARYGEPLFLPVEPKQDDDNSPEQKNADADGDGAAQTPAASGAKKSGSAAPEPRRAPVTDEDIPAELLDADGDGAAPTPSAVQTTNTPAATSPAATSPAAPAVDETLDLFPEEAAAPAPTPPQSQAPAAPTPPNVVPLPIKARTFKYGDTIERLGDGPFKTKDDTIWAQAVDLYVLHCEQVEAHRGTRGIKARYTFTKRSQARINKIRALLRAAEAPADIAAAIRGVFYRPFNMGENKDGTFYFELETICADGGSKLNLYGGFDPENAEARQGRAARAAQSASNPGRFEAGRGGLPHPSRANFDVNAAHYDTNREYIIGRLRAGTISPHDAWVSGHGTMSSVEEAKVFWDEGAAARGEAPWDPKTETPAAPTWGDPNMTSEERTKRFFEKIGSRKSGW